MHHRAYPPLHTYSCSLSKITFGLWETAEIAMTVYRYRVTVFYADLRYKSRDAFNVSKEKYHCIVSDFPPNLSSPRHVIDAVLAKQSIVSSTNTDSRYTTFWLFCSYVFYIYELLKLLTIDSGALRKIVWAIEHLSR